jgi:predicted TIM-barrel fold metal-dependent hydrolase
MPPLRAIDCDVHPALPEMPALMPYLPDHWRDAVTERGIPSLESISYPPHAPITARPDWRGEDGLAAASLGDIERHVFARFGADIAVLNCLYGVQLVFNEDMAHAFARAVNDWIVQEWLDRDPRLRASIVVPLQNVEHAVDEIARCASDRRFVQILLLAMGEVPLGRRQFWPVYAAAERHGLPIGIHAGSAYRHPVTSLGWPSYYAEDYAAQTHGFQSQVASLISEGVFAKFPGLKVVLIESGVTWLPGFLWRFAKFWRGLRSEVPWVERSPDEIVRDHFRLTIQPLDAPSPDLVERAIDHLRSDDMLLYASDFPHWQFDGDDAMPAGVPPAMQRKILVDNPLATYNRLSAEGGPP